MPYSFKVDQDLGLVVVRGTGGLTAEDVKSFHLKLKEDPSFRPEMNQLIDLRDGRLETSGPEIQALASRPLFSHEAKRAGLISDDLHYGIARQWSIHGTDKLGELRPFRDLVEACEWLGIQPSVAEELLAELKVPRAT